MRKILFPIAFWFLGSVAVQAQGHPGIQQKIVDGCDGMSVFDESIGDWVCDSSTSGGSGGVKTCTQADCPATNEKGESVQNCFYIYKIFQCIKVCRYRADGTSDYGQIVDKSFCGKS